jgi:hypothetical protein
MVGAKSIEDLARLLPVQTWYPKVDTKILADFLSSVKYVDGHLAHMEHEEIQSALVPRIAWHRPKAV